MQELKEKHDDDDVEDFMEGKCVVWSDILLYGMITQRLDYARGRARKYQRWRGVGGTDGRADAGGLRGKSRRGVKDFSHCSHVTKIDFQVENY